MSETRREAVFIDECFLKCRRVILSCKTLEQFRTANNYVHLYWRRVFDYDAYKAHQMTGELNRRLSKVLGRNARLF